MDRWLPFVGIALLVEAALGFLPAVRRSGSEEIGQLVQSACAAAAGGAALMAARRRASPDALRAFLWLAFLALGGLKVGAYLVHLNKPAFMNAWMLLSNASGSMLGIGAPVLWAAALARRDDPGTIAAQKVGRIAGGVVQVGFVLLFASEIAPWALVFTYSGSGSMPGLGGYGFYQALQLPDRVLLLWASVESVRSWVDKEVARQRAARIHTLMGWWLLSSLVAAGVGQIILATWASSSVGFSPSRIQQVLLRIVVHKTVAVAAMLALYLHFASARSRQPEAA